MELIGYLAIFAASYFIPLIAMVIGAYGSVARHEEEKRTGVRRVPIFRESSRQILSSR